MPPDANLLRHRHGKNLAEEDEDNSSTVNAKPLKELKPSEVAIDGVVYDLTNFAHPGGESINVFGGNDVTAHYKMIHPHHTAKHLEKMTRVGTVTDYKPDYIFDTPFERELKKEVFKIVRRGKEFGTPGYFFRAFFCIGLMAFLQYNWVTVGSSFALAIIYGISQALIGLNVQHDANHGAVSRKSWVNDLLGYGADFIGGCKWHWMEQHWTHHAFTNDEAKDPDAHGAEPFLLFHDYPMDHPIRSWLHNFQAYFYIFVLAGYWFSEVFSPQIFDLKQRGAQARGMVMESDYLKSRRPIAIVLRLLYIYTNVVTPFLNHGLTVTPLLHVLTMAVSESLTLSILFSLSHNFEQVDRDPVAESKRKGELGVCWYKAQVETSSTYGGFISGCVTGGLNFQVEHHLFPRMSSAWYPYIAPTVRAVCKKHGVRYAYYPWVFQNLISTVKYMHQAGTGANWAKNPLSGEF